MRRVGITPEVNAKVREALEAGGYQTDAAAYAGISPRTYWSWLERGRAAVERIEAGEDVDETDAALAAFLHMVDGSRARVTVELAGCIREAASRDWRAAAWWLERSHPETYGKRSPGKPGTSGEAFPLDPDGFAAHVDAVLDEAARRWDPDGTILTRNGNGGA